MMCCMQAQELVVKSVRHDVLYAGGSGEECLSDMMCCMQTVPVKSASQMEELLMQGLRNRSVAATKMNATSSRSHLVVTIHFQQVCSTCLLMPVLTFFLFIS